ncbi:MAG TPA: DUF4129 domain-containing protein [Gaiellaceae bacterium]|jgi:hypothetical protein
MGVDPGDRRRLLVPAGLALLALLAVAALAAGGRPLGISRGGGGPSGTFVDYAWTTLLIILVLWVAFAIWCAYEYRGSGASRRPTRRWWLTIPLFTAIVCLAVLLLHVAHFNLGRLGIHAPGGGTRPPAATEANKQRKGPVHDATFRWEELAAVLGTLGLLATLVVIRRRGGMSAFPSLRLRAAERISAELDEAVDDLRADPDVRRAIIAAYARTERALAAYGLPRHRSEAPLEYLERALGELDASASSIRRLTDLFEWAKFSQHDPEPGMREEAIDALLAVRDELRRPIREPVAL